MYSTLEISLYTVLTPKLGRGGPRSYMEGPSRASYHFDRGGLWLWGTLTLQYVRTKAPTLDCALQFDWAGRQISIACRLSTWENIEDALQ